MRELMIPERIQGRWEYLLILTYGADIPFFERTLWRQLPERCRNRVILADGDTFLESCNHYANAPDLVRYLNQRYLAEGVFAPRAMHAKAILLSTETNGRLLVGSGNLGWQGYASGGEAFTSHSKYGSGN